MALINSLSATNTTVIKAIILTPFSTQLSLSNPRIVYIKIISKFIFNFKAFYILRLPRWFILRFIFFFFRAPWFTNPSER